MFAEQLFDPFKCTITPREGSRWLVPVIVLIAVLITGYMIYKVRKDEQSVS